MRYWELIGHYNGEAQTWEALAGAFQTSPYSPLVRGRLKGLRIMLGGEAATSLIEGVEFRLSCPLWTPNTMTIGGMGAGLRTALTPPIPVVDFEVDQPVDTGSQITIEGRHNVATAVTVQAFLFGLFEA